MRWPMRWPIRVSQGLVVVAAAMLPLSFAAAEPAESNDPAELKQEIQDLAQRLAILERKLEVQQEAAQAAAAETPVVKASPKGFSFQSKDGANLIKFRGLLQVDDRYFLDDVTPPSSSTAGLRRVRPIIEGTVNNIYDFRLTPDFAAGKVLIYDAFVSARFQPSFVLTAGKFKPPVGLERLQSAADIRFVERGLPTDLVPNRDIGVQISGDVFSGHVNYALGYFNGVADGTGNDFTADVDTDGDGDAAARLFFQPGATSDNFALRGFGIGVAATYAHTDGTLTSPQLAPLKTPGQVNFFNYRTGATATFADGQRLRIVPQFYYYYGRYGILGEYVQSSNDVTRVNGAVTRSDKLKNDAWQIAFHWFVTGEEEAYRGYPPANIFSPANHTWGALELVARYHQLTIDSDTFVGGADSFADSATQAQRATAWGIGVNWYFNQNIKWVLDYDRTKFDGGAAAGADRGDEEVLLSRLQLSF
jgi:phosphate-selective porin OprO and OprP